MAKDGIGLIGFPALLDHMMTRLLSEYGVAVERFDVERSVSALNSLRLAFFFWPERGDQGMLKMKILKSASSQQRCPVIIVATSTGCLDAQQHVGYGADAIIQTPLRPQDVSDALSKYAMLVDARNIKSVNVEYVNNLLRYTLESLQQLTGLKCERTSLEYSTEASVSGYVTGTIGFSGSADGYMTATFPKALATKIANATMSSRTENATEIEISTSVSELIESIAHAARDSVCNVKERLLVSAPQVIAGGPHIVSQHRGVPVVVLKFKAADEFFSLLIHLRPRPN